MLTSKFLFGHGLLGPDAHMARGQVSLSCRLGEVGTSGFFFPPLFLLNVRVIVYTACTTHLLTGLRASSGAYLGRSMLSLA
jgi:hypothetical protein